MGTTVTINGSGFDALAGTYVKFNGAPRKISATVVSSNKLTVVVPSQATTGVIQVTVGYATTGATSQAPFTVTTGPTITGFSPISGVVGDVVTIIGVGFSSTPSANTVTFNGVPAIVASNSTTTQLLVTVPARATSGPIRVVVDGVSVASSPSFNVSCPSIENVTTVLNGYAYSSIGIDSTGNIYLIDQNAIYRVTPEGSAVLLAGDVATSGTLNGTGSAARFNNPQGLAVDSAGNVYVADAGNSTIRKVTPDGVVTTIAGSPGMTGSQDGGRSAARFNNPTFITIDRKDTYLYVADSGNSVIRKVTLKQQLLTPTTGVATLAGTAGVTGTADGIGPAAQFSSLKGITLDLNNNVYVADGNAIRKIDQSGTVSTFVGNVTASGSQNGVGSAARFSQPIQIAADSFGQIYVADSLNNTIREVSPDGSVTDFAGGSAPTQIYPDPGYGISAVFSLPLGVVVNSQGIVYVAEPAQGNLRKVTAVPNCPAPTCSSMGPKNAVVAGSATTTRFYAYGVQNATIVYFPTWWLDGGNQNDIQWLAGTDDGGGTWHADVPLSQYDTGNPRYGNFATHVYMANPDYQSGAAQWCDGTGWVRKAPQPPIAPGAVTVPPTTSSATLTVSWTQSTSSDPATYFELQRAISVTGPWTSINANIPASATSYSDTVPGNGTYYYEVAACNAVGCSGYTVSSGVVVTLPAIPNPPASVTVPASSSSVTIPVSWTPSSTGSAATYYYLQRLDPNASSWTMLNWHITTTNFTDTSVSASGTYYYRAAACNDQGCSNFTTSSAVAVTLPSPPPNPPTSVTASSPINTNNVIVSWTPSANGSAPTYYNVQKSTSTSGPWTPADGNVGSGTTSYTESGLVPDTYYYEVAACNAQGCSAFTVSAGVTVQSAYPSASTCPANSVPPVASGTTPISPGRWWNPNRYGTGWDFYFGPGGIMFGLWYTYDQNHHPVWLISDVAQFTNGLWTAPLYEITWKYGSPGNRVASQVGTLWATQIPGQPTELALRWQWNGVGSHPDECLYDLFQDNSQSPSSNVSAAITSIDATYSGDWSQDFNNSPPSATSNWGLSLTIAHDSTNMYSEVDGVLIYDIAGNPVWLQSANNTSTAPAANATFGLNYFMSNYSGGFPTSQCTSQQQNQPQQNLQCIYGWASGSPGVSATVTRSFTSPSTGTASISAQVDTSQMSSPSLPAGATPQTVSWFMPGATSGTATTVDIYKDTSADLIFVNATYCTVPSGQSTCPIVVDWDGLSTAEQAWRVDEVTQTSTLLNSGNSSGTFTDNLSVGAKVHYELRNGTTVVSATNTVVATGGTSTPVSATPTVVMPPARDSVSDRVGATLASFRVDETGNATYSIPIQIPPGTAGVAPKLSLSYNSRLPNGVMGPGWSIAGSSQITRCRQTRESGDFMSGTTPIDGNPPPVNFTTTDRFCLDGVRLLLLSGNTGAYGADGTTYSPETDPTTLVTAHVTTLAAGPATFTVQRKDGTTSTYGNTSASSNATVTAMLPATGASVNVNWSLARAQDSAGNYMDYLYTSDPSGSTFPFGAAAVESVLYQVNYTGHATSPVSSPYASITFSYTTQAIGQVRLGYQAGIAFLQSQQLQNVTVTNNGTTMRYYGLTYGTSASGSGLQQLRKVQECRDSSMNVCFSPTTFAWSQANYTYIADTSQNGPSFNNIVGYKVADIDGDGRQDFVYALDGDSNCSTSAVYVGFLDQNASHQMTLLTFNQKPICSLIDLANNDQAWYLFDYNGDGKADLMMGGAAGSNWVVYPSLGRPSTGNPVFDKTNNLLATLKTQITVPAGMNAAGVLADLNGDGLPDFIYPAAQTGFANAAARIMVRQSDGTFAFSDPYNLNFNWAPGDTNCTGVNTNCDFNFFYNDTTRHSAIATDIDGDGRADMTMMVLAQTDNGGGKAPAGAGQLTFNPTIGTGQVINSPLTITNKFFWYQFTVSNITPPSGTTPGSITFAEYWNAQMGVNGVPSNQNQFYVADLNGDGLADILYQDPVTTTTYHALINSGHGYQAPIDATNISTNNTNPPIQLADINGDGRMDLVYPISDNAYDYVSVVPSASGNGWAFSSPQGALSAIHTGSGWIAFFGDFDGDGVPDFLSMYPSSSGLIYSSRIAGGSCTSESNSAACSRYHAHDVIIGFTNGLGATTTVVYQPLTNEGVYQRGSENTKDTGIPALQYDKDWGWSSPVFDVIAPMYVVSEVKSSAPTKNSPGNLSTVYYAYTGALMQSGGRGFLGFYENISFDNNDSANEGNQYMVSLNAYAQRYPFIGMPEFTSKSAFTGTLTRGLAKLDTCANNIEDASNCFLPAGSYPWPWPYDTGVVVSTGGAQPACNGAGCSAVSTTNCTSASGAIAAPQEVTAGLFTPPAVAQPVFPYAYITADTQADLGAGIGFNGAQPTANSTSYFCYDTNSPSHGDLINSRTVTTDGANNVVAQKLTTNTYQDDTTHWFLGRLTNSTITFVRPNTPNITRTSDFTYDPTTGILKSEEIEKGQGANLDLLTVYTLDAYSNRTGAYQCSVDAAGSCVSTSFASQQSGTTVHRYARTNFDSLGRYSTGSILPFSSVPAISIVSRDEFGNPTQQSSINGLVQYSEAGALGRPYFSSDNTGKATTTTFRLCTTVSCPSDAKFRSQTVTVGGPMSWTYYDVLGRAILKVGQAFDANPTNQSFSAVCSYFDAHNRPAYQSEPFFLPATINSTDGSPSLTSSSPCTGSWPATSTVYDVLGRVVRVNDPDGGIVYKTYSGLVTTTSNPRNSSWVVTETRNALGELVSRQDPVDPSDSTTGLLAINGYDAAGDLLTVTRSAGSGNIVTSMTYDALGRKSTLSDPDAGGMSYIYNAAGDVISQTDAKNQTIAQSYDAMGRRWQRTAGGIADSWMYDNAANGFGMLASESRTQSGNPTFSRSMTYDGYGRPYQRATSIAGTAYTETTAYDSHGRLLAQQDASGYSVSPAYSPNGFVSEQDDSRVGNVYQLMGTDARGQAALDERAGLAGLSSSYSYDAAGRISTICTGVNCGLQDLSYTFDFAGNLTKRERAVRTAPTIEVFTNDALNRLKLAQLTEIQGVVQGTPQTTQSLVYDQLGNICTKNGTVYSYAGLAGCTNHGSIGSPQAVISAGGNTYGYDADGNQTSGAGRTLTYNAFNQMISASSGSISTAFLYTPEGERFMRTDSSGTTTYYIGSVEKLATGSTWEIRRYLPGGAIDYVRSSGSNETRYTFSDHLGSLDLVATAAGAVYETASFDAFGNLRNSANWSGTAAAPASTTHGFTGHEEIYSLGLTHMNGRIYDPVLGRMLQADPMTGPGNQSLNRYSYVVNNPLSLTDPSGYSWWHTLDRIAGWITFGPFFPSVQNDYYATLANPYVRMAGAIVASYFTFGAVYGAFSAEFVAGTGGAIAAGATAGAASGFVGAAIQTRSFQMAWRGALAGAIAGEIVGYYGKVQSLQRVGVETIAGGVESKIQGGDFIDGVKFAFFISTLNYANYRMREIEVQKSAQHDYNLNGDSSGFYDDGKKLAGSRREFDPLLNREICDSTAGGCQGAPVNPGDVRGRLGPINYEKGSSIDNIVESFAGPHDWLRDLTGSYDQWGNSYHFEGFAAKLDWMRNYVEIPMAAPFAISGLIHETPGVYQPLQACFAVGECR